jgi:hypothetical protein
VPFEVVTHGELISLELIDREQRAACMRAGPADDIHAGRCCRAVDVVVTAIDYLIAAIDDAVAAAFQQQVAHAQIRHRQRRAGHTGVHRHPGAFERAH